MEPLGTEERATFHVIYNYADLSRQGLLRTLAQPLVVDEGAVRALGVLEVELALLVPQQRVVPREDLAVEDSVRGAGPRPRHRPPHLDGLVEHECAVLERVRVGAARKDGLRTEPAAHPDDDTVAA